MVISPGDAPAYRAAAGEHIGRLRFVEQGAPLGYGHAIFCAREFVGTAPFLHLVGDHLYVSRTARSCAAQLVDLADAESCAVSAVQSSRESQLPYYGTVGGRRAPGRQDLYLIEQVIEKPTPTEAEQQLMVPGLRVGHYLCFFGMHVLTPGVMDILAEQVQAAGDRGGVQLSPALAVQAPSAMRTLQSPPPGPPTLITAINGRAGSLSRLIIIGSIPRKKLSAAWAMAGVGTGTARLRRSRASVKCDQVWTRHDCSARRTVTQPQPTSGMNTRHLQRKQHDAHLRQFFDPVANKIAPRVVVTPVEGAGARFVHVQREAGPAAVVGDPVNAVRVRAYRRRAVPMPPSPPPTFAELRRFGLLAVVKTLVAILQQRAANTLVDAPGCVIVNRRGGPNRPVEQVQHGAGRALRQVGCQNNRIGAGLRRALEMRAKLMQKRGILRDASDNRNRLIALDRCHPARKLARQRAARRKSDLHRLRPSKKGKAVAWLPRRATRPVVHLPKFRYGATRLLVSLGGAIAQAWGSRPAVASSPSGQLSATIRRFSRRRTGR